MATPKARNTPGSTGYGQTPFEREAGQEQKTLALRLPNTDIEALRFLWCELASMIGLKSNMQFQRLALAKRSRQDPAYAEKRRAHAREKHKEKTAAQKLSERAAEALAALPEHMRIALAPEPVKKKPKPSRAERINGVLVAHGATFSCMALGVGQSGGRVRKVPHEMVDPWTGEHISGLMSELLSMEAWTDLKNAKLANQAKECRATLNRMVDVGDSNLVNVLFAMYGEAQPPSEFPKLEDLAPLVLDTPLVLKHAAQMTKKLRAGLLEASEMPDIPMIMGESTGKVDDEFVRDRMQDRRESVTPRTAAHDLLDRRSQETPERTAQRVTDTSTIRTEATKLLICASVSYQRAKRFVNGS